MFDASWTQEAWKKKDTSMTEEEKKDESLCRFHRKKQMSFCKNDDPEVQQGCKFYEPPSKYLQKGGRQTCDYYDTSTTGLVVNGYHHCTHPDAQWETYHNSHLQVDQ